MTRRPSQGSRPVTFVVLACLLWGVPVAISFLVQPSRAERDVLWPDDLEARTSIVGERSDDGAQAATLQLEWSTPSSVMLPPGVTGVVTDVWIHDGAAVEDGSALVSVDGVARLAQTTGRPMYREIRSGDSGPDVDWLDALLVRMGAAPAPTLDVEGRATRATTQAVKELQKWIGADPDGVFRPEYTVWARSPGQEGATTEVGSVATAVGAQAAPGTELFRTAAGLEQARIQLDATPSRQALLREVPLSMTVDGTTVDVSGIELNSDDLHVLEGMFDPTATDVDAVVLRRQVAFEPGAAPSSAVIPLGDGRGCLIVVSPDQTYEPRRFSLFTESSLEPGVTYVPSDLIGQTILTNPSQELSSLCS